MITAKEKAEELIRKFGNQTNAIICVEEIIDLFTHKGSALRAMTNTIKYWEEVLEEIDSFKP